MESDDLWMRSLRDAANDLTDSRFRRFRATDRLHAPDRPLPAVVARRTPGEVHRQTLPSKVFNRIAEAIDNFLTKQHLFFVTGERRTGKTFLFNSLIAHVRGTVHSVLQIRNDIDEIQQSRFAQDIRTASMIFIDEVSMMDDIVLRYINKTIWSCFIDNEVRDLSFAGRLDNNVNDNNRAFDRDRFQGEVPSRNWRERP
ncbi:hypothetical protein L596_021723 [Steinernema carpocapsae]|uniref:ATP-dependent DNA helicase n=1 Tax=Steinernema carpocapsae TaxID=34508 RepID=A0A4U5MKE8_STECR|nr:hypothetical protein L596_021723 [Steinernema carpocapsae]